MLIHRISFAVFILPFENIPRKDLLITHSKHTHNKFFCNENFSVVKVVTLANLLFILSDTAHFCLI